MGSDGQSITVMMPKIARKTLGLADGTFSRIEIEHHSLVFKGDGVTRPVVAPVSMLGMYTSDMLNNLFLYMRNNRQNGVLSFTTGPLTKSVFFKTGSIVFAGSTLSRFQLHVDLPLHVLVVHHRAPVLLGEQARRLRIRFPVLGRPVRPDPNVGVAPVNPFVEGAIEREAM